MRMQPYSRTTLQAVVSASVPVLAAVGFAVNLAHDSTINAFAFLSPVSILKLAKLSPLRSMLVQVPACSGHCNTIV